ncbi:MAG: ATP-dependent endonuclease [Dehalococcoidia bacterium]|nr:ATP-dependent endonuclease [Dehalococcoidia bacterium]
MRISQVSIRNFRALKQLEELRLDDMSIIIGKNDTGKSSILYALDLFFEKRKVKSSDYFKPPGSAPRADAIEIEVVFTNLDDDLLDRLRAEGYLQADDCLRIKRTFTGDSEQKTEQLRTEAVCEDFINEEFRNLPLRREAELNALIKEKGIPEVGRSGAGRTNWERWGVIRQWAAEHGEARKTQPLEPSRDALSAIKAALPQFVLFPAVTSLATDQASFQREFSELVADALQEQAAIQDTLEKEIKTRVRDEVSRLESLILQQTTAITGVSPRTEFDWGKLVTLDLDVRDAAGIEVELGNRGLGIQRLTWVAFFNYRVQKPSREGLEAKPYVFAMEEPEVFLHPGAQRELFYALRRNSEAGTQVLVSSHSPIFVDRSSLARVILLRRDANGVAKAFHAAGSDISEEELVQAVKLELGLRNSDYFFANCVLLVDGDTEEAAYPQLARKFLGKEPDEIGLQIVKLGGKTNARLFIQALRVFDVPRVLVADKDADQLETGKKYRPVELVREGLIAEDDCFRYDQGEFEHEFPDEVLAQTLNDSKIEGVSFTADEICSFKAAAEPGKKFMNILDSELWKRAKYHLDKKTFGYSLAINCPNEDIPRKMKDALDRVAFHCELKRT